MPELAGLFLGWQGTTGIITKMAVSLWPKPRHSVTLSFAMPDLKSSYELLKALRWTRVPDDLIGTSFQFGKVARMANEQHLKISLHPAQPVLPDEPEFVISAEISGNTEDELNAKADVVKIAAEKALPDSGMQGPSTSPSSRAHLPMQAIDVLSAGGGLTWVGCYGPMSRWLETFEKCCAVQDKYDITRSGYTRIMNEGHFAAIRWLLPFNKEDPEDVDRIKALSLEQLDIVLETGFIPYKTPIWAVRKLEEKAGKNWVDLHRRVKAMLDPDTIMNPGRWGA